VSSAVRDSYDVTVRSLRIQGYRSVRSIRLPLERLNVFVGPNGSGKSNLYRAMVLLAAAANGTLAQALAIEGGMPSALWAGPRQKGSVRLLLGCRCADYEYQVVLGLPGPTDTAFRLDPVVRKESITLIDAGRRIAMMQRDNRAASLRNRDGRRIAYDSPLLMTETALAQIRDPGAYPEQSQLRELMAAWRFYHHFRTDPQSPIRQPQVGVLTPILSSDGNDLAAALRSAAFLGDDRDIRAAIDAAFPGAELRIEDNAGRLSLGLQMPDIQRPFDARELSDGTLRYLCLVGALLSYRLPAFVALNEPETSLHPDLLPALGRLIARASSATQLFVVTHARALIDEIEQVASKDDLALIELTRDQDGTQIIGQEPLDEPAWHFPDR